MKATIAALAGDGIGPEVMQEAYRLLNKIEEKYGHQFTITEGLIGGIAIDETGDPFPPETVKICEEADAVLLAAVGGYKWDDPTAKVRPEQGLLRMRKHFGLFANLRPVKIYPALAEHVPLRADLLDGVDILFVRELTGGVYFGERKEMGDDDHAYDTLIYSKSEVERVANIAFRAAQGRGGKLTSIDKANVLASMRLWRSTVVKVHEEYSDVELEHLLVDAATMHLLTRPSSFDVIMAGNMFGDILSDEASVLAGSLGMLPSASLGEGTFGVYEPVHGSAPDIAGQGKANPIGMFLSIAMMLRYSLQLEDEAKAIEAAVDAALADGARTGDIAGKDDSIVTTSEFTDLILAKL
ncbi:MAG: 3-isopropylmalate dehydrogenase [Aggregatilineales bacterium]